MAKIKLPKKSHSMLTFGRRRTYGDFRSLSRGGIELKVIKTILTHPLIILVRGLTLTFSRMLGDLIAGSPRKMNATGELQIVFNPVTAL